jgi:hypothetical protein
MRGDPIASRLVPAGGTRGHFNRPNDMVSARKSRPAQAAFGTGATGLEPATSGVTGRRSNQLSYAPRGRVAAPRTGCGGQYGTRIRV